MNCLAVQDQQQKNNNEGEFAFKIRNRDRPKRAQQSKHVQTIGCFDVNQQAQQVVNQRLNTDALLEMLGQMGEAGVADDFISHCFNALRLVQKKGL